VLQDALILSVDNIFESWVVDSGASFHATPHRKHFLDYVQGDFGQVHLGDDKPCKIVGMGKVKIKQRNGNQCGNKTQKIHNTRETQIYVVHPVWATSTREIARSFLYYYLANEGIQPTAKPVVTSSSFSHSLFSQNTIFTLNHSHDTFPS